MAVAHDMVAGPSRKGMPVSVTEFESLPLDAGSFVKGMPVNGATFVAVTTFRKLLQITRNPVDLQPTAKRVGYEADALEEEASVHELIQRALTGAKKANVARYAQYIEDVVMGQRVGVLPPMHLFTQEKLEIVRHVGDQYALIPTGMRLLAIDGETQLTGHYQLQRNGSPEVREAHANFTLTAIIHNGISVDMARQYFYDLNILAVRPNIAISLSMNTVDPLNRVVVDVEAAVPAIAGKVDKQARQLRKHSPKLLTVGALRQMIVNVAKGIAGIQYGARPLEVEDLDLVRLSGVSRDWLNGFFNTFAAQVQDRDRYVAAAAPVLAAVGAIGHKLYQANPEERPALQAELLADLERVDWTKGERWAGILGKFTDRGTFSIGGTKETAYTVYNVLTDPTNPGWHRIRGQAVPTPTPTDPAT